MCQRRGTQYSAESSEQSLSLAHNKFLWISDPKCTAVTAPVGTNNSLNTINSLKCGASEHLSRTPERREKLWPLLCLLPLICLKAPRYFRSKGKVVMTRWYAQRVERIKLSQRPWQLKSTVHVWTQKTQNHKNVWRLGLRNDSNYYFITKISGG